MLSSFVIEGKDVTDAEIAFGRYTSGSTFPITTIIEDAAADLALLKIDPAFELPGAAEYYDLRKSNDFKNWPVEQLDGLSLFMFGFPIDNSRPLLTVGNRTFYFIGCAPLTTCSIAPTPTQDIGGGFRLNSHPKRIFCSTTLRRKASSRMASAGPGSGLLRMSRIDWYGAQTQP